MFLNIRNYSTITNCKEHLLVSITFNHIMFTLSICSFNKERKEKQMEVLVNVLVMLLYVANEYQVKYFVCLL